MLKRTMQLVISNYFSHSVGRNGAALAYYLLFTLFPLLIFISSLLGLLELDVAAATETLAAFLPREIVELLGTYLEYASRSFSGSVFGFSLVFSVYFPMRAAKCLMDAVRRAYGLEKPTRPVVYLLRRLAYTVVLFVVIALTLLLSTLGQRVLGYVAGRLPVAKLLPVSGLLLTLWHYLRFLLIAVMMLAALGALYAMSQDRRQPASAIMPGVAAALGGWLAVSVGFSFYVENFARYSILYGALGAVIVLLTWLYLTAVILILGAELNAALRMVRSSDFGDKKKLRLEGRDDKG